MEKFRFCFIMSENERESYQKILQSDDVDITSDEPLNTPEDAALVDAKFVDLVGVITVGTLAAIALRLFDLITQKEENGTVIDFSKDPFEVNLIANVPYGTIVVIDPQGNSHIEKIDPNKVGDAMPLLNNLFEKYAKK